MELPCLTLKNRAGISTWKNLRKSKRDILKKSKRKKFKLKIDGRKILRDIRTAIPNPYKVDDPAILKSIETAFPKRYKVVNFMVHVRDEGHRPDGRVAPIERLLQGAVKIHYLRRIIIGVDRRTTDDTREICLKYEKIYSQFDWVIYDFDFIDFSQAKNLLIFMGEKAGMRPGEIICVRGGDWSLTDSFINGHKKWVDMWVAHKTDFFMVRTFVPENSRNPLINLSNYILKGAFSYHFGVCRDRVADWVFHIHMQWRDSAHENSYKDGYAISGLGEYWKKHHGLPCIGMCYHHGQKEDSPALALFKKYFYIVLTQCDTIAYTYGIKEAKYAYVVDADDVNAVNATWDYAMKNNMPVPRKEVLRTRLLIEKYGIDKTIQIENDLLLQANFEVMFRVSKTKDEISMIDKGWMPWVEFMALKYINGFIPKGLYKYYMDAQRSANITPVYG